MEAIILCAGEGTRLRPLTHHVAKPLFPVLCEPLLGRILDNLIEHGIYRAAANVFYRREDFFGFVEAGVTSIVNLSLVQEDELLGTGGGIANVAANLRPKGTFIVHTGDVYAEIDFTSAIRSHRASGAKLTFLVRSGAKEIITENDVVVDINGRLGAQGDTARKFTGISIWEPEILEFMPRAGTPGNAVDGWLGAIRAFPGEIRVFDIGESLWADIGTTRDYVALHKELLCGENFVPGGVEIPPGVRLESNVCICSGAKIGEGCELRDVVVWQGGEISPGTVLDGAIVGPFGIHRL